MILKSVILQKKNLLRIDFSSQKLTFYPLIYPTEPQTSLYLLFRFGYRLFHFHSIILTIFWVFQFKMEKLRKPDVFLQKEQFYSQKTYFTA